MPPRPSYVKIVIAVAALAFFSHVWGSLERSDVFNMFDLVIHEAGHWIFMPFGRFAHALGGSALQTIVPAVFAGYFWWRRELFATGVILMWLGLSLADVSAYAADAVVMRLPLLGDGLHDWNYLLSVVGALRHTAAVAWVIGALGVVALWSGFSLALWDGLSPREKVWRRGWSGERQR